MKFAYYPGCSAKASTRELDTAANRLAEELGIELVELVEAGCCGSCEIKAVDPQLHLSLNARILALAAGKNLEILTVCDTCQANLLQTSRQLASDAEALAAARSRLKTAGVEFRGPPRVRHFLTILAEEIGLDELRRRVKRPLDGLRAAPFACCHSFRGPGASTGSREILDDIVTLTGASVIPARADGHCCGFHILMVNEDVAARAAGKFLARCKEMQADCVVTSSPLCHTALDIYQRKIERVTGERIGIPVFHAEQLIALSLGCAPEEVALARHLVPVQKALEKFVA